MSLKKLIDINNLHHAYCIEGDNASTALELKDFLKESLGIETIGNPDFWYQSHDTFSIEESRKLKENQQARSFSGKKIFIISCNFINREAQNALLKIFEEPTEGTHFFILTKTADILLPTLKSRLVIVNLSKESVDKKEIQSFVKANISKRILYIKEIIDLKDKNRGIIFLDSLEGYLKGEGLVKESSHFLGEVLELKKFLFSQGSSLKLVLEHVALTCPK
ncbi:MAG: hypothetical protein RJA61_524 [Candidatus Parcubacteria bacterium]|jgi:DNA polymerase III delta prime subunit